MYDKKLMKEAIICSMCHKYMIEGEECMYHPYGVTCKPCWIEWRHTFVYPGLNNIIYDIYKKK
jgi:hypothetical protein